MFGLFKKKTKKAEESVNNTLELFAVTSGEIIPITEVEDAVFAQKMMGDGFAVKPNSEGTIFSPVAGKVSTIFPTQHAIGITTEQGVDILVHMGINTVELNGKGFKTLVEAGDTVTPETALSQVDLAVLESEGKDTAIIVILTNMDIVTNFEVIKNGNVVACEAVAHVNVK